MRKLAALCSDNSIQRTNLIQQACADRGQRQAHFLTTEIHAVRKTGMRADRNSVQARSAHQTQHFVGAAGMPSTCDIDRGNTVEYCLIIDASLTEIGIQVNEHGGSFAYAANNHAAFARLVGPLHGSKARSESTCPGRSGPAATGRQRLQKRFLDNPRWPVHRPSARWAPRWPALELRPEIPRAISILRCLA